VARKKLRSRNSHQPKKIQIIPLLWMSSVLSEKIGSLEKTVTYVNKTLTKKKKVLDASEFTRCLSSFGAHVAH
jgi:hypothetical protein